MAKRLIITCMKNEGPFILEWLAYHLSIGFDHVLVFTNDCEDGTVELLDTLAGHGLVTRMDNPYETMQGGFNPQKGALKFAEDLDLPQKAEWVLISDVDEFVNVHVGDGSLDALFAAVPEAALISLQWRLFGCGDHDNFEDSFLTERHVTCAPRFCPAPIQAWGIKTMFRTKGSHVAGAYAKFGVHRPLKKRENGPVPWVNGSGQQVPDAYLESGWRFGIGDYGYDLVTLNHYATRSAESFLVKRDRGRVNHIERDQGLSYWLRMNFNMETDLSIQPKLPAMRARYAELMSLPGVSDHHTKAVAAHRNKIAELRARKDMGAFFDEITSPRMKLISRHLNFLSRGQFNDGPDSVPQQLIERLEKLPVL